MTGQLGKDAHLAGLNAAQKRAVVHESGPLIVLAGPGTGKTRVIVRRIVHMIRTRGIDPSTILALTFTNKAAGEMRERLAMELDAVTAERVHAHTFNGFGALLLRRFSDLAGLPGEPALIDSAQRTRIMRSIVSARGLFRESVAEGLDSAIERANRLIGAMTSAGLTPEAARAAADERLRTLETAGLDRQELIAERAEASRLREIATLWTRFDETCRAKGVLGFDHQIAWTNRLLAENKSARAYVGRDYKHVVVDEFQDVNNAQIELLRLVAPPGGGQKPDLCVVGDDDQAIYGFRGADDRAFVKFDRLWRGATTVMLEENYRSGSAVLNVAASVIGRAHERFREDKIVRRPDGVTGEPTGASAEGVALEHYLQVGEVIASMVRRDLAERAGAKLADHAVIGRTWGEVHRIRATLELEGFACRSAKSRAPNEDPGVLDVMAWINLLLNPTHTWSARRLLLRPPFTLPLEWVNRTENLYRGVTSRIEDANTTARAQHASAAAKMEPVPAGALADRPVPAYTDWMVESLASGALSGDDDVRATVDRFAGLWTELRAQSATAPAAEVIAEIVRRSDVVHAELLDGRGRAARVSAVVGLMRFAAERAARLDEPGDLSAFMAYYDDLDDHDKALRSGGLTHEDDENPEDAEAGGGDAIHLLTAHGSKGLEFDTVYLPRVESQHGYPSLRSRDDDEGLPAWMVAAIDPEDAGRDDATKLHDEERRLFYVACTRAERRLVVLGKLPKNKPAGTNYFWELREEPGLLTEREAADLLGPHARDGVDHAMPAVDWNASEKRRERVRDARRVARLDAAIALERAVLPGLDGEGFAGVVDGLRSSAERMAVIACAQRGEPVPEWIEDETLRALHAAILDTQSDAPVVPASGVLTPMPAPVTLSYTMIKEWEQCPRCFAVKYRLRLPEPETTKTVVGKVVHTALEQFYQRVKAASLADNERDAAPPTLDDLLALGTRAFDGMWSASEVVDTQQRDRVLALLRNTHEHLHHDGLNPTEMEADIFFQYQPEGSTSGPHRFRAKIDRIDESPAGYLVVDYKSGRATKTLTEPKKDDLQFGIYALALRAFIVRGERNPDGSPVGIDGVSTPAGGAEYWVLATGERGRVSFDELAEYEPKLRRRIDRAIEGMLAGAYERGSKCGGSCAFLDPAVDSA